MMNRTGGRWMEGIIWVFVWVLDGSRGYFSIGILVLVGRVKLLLAKLLL